jgi:hypothetical protein
MNSKLLNVLVEEIDALDKRREKFSQEIEGLKAAMAEIDAERDVLERIRQRHASQFQSRKSGKGNSASEQNGSRTSPTHEIILTLRKNPNGLTGKVLADMISPRIVTKAKNKRRLIFSLTSQLKRHGKILQKDGLYRLPESRGNEEEI